MAQQGSRNENGSATRTTPAISASAELFEASAIADSNGVSSEAIYDDNGVDRTLIRSSLRRTPSECLDILEDIHRLAESVRHER